MASTSESALISILETSDSKGISSLVSDFLQPFSDIKKPKKCKKSANPSDNSSAIRSLAKEFLPFINRALSVLPKRLSEPSKLNNDLGFAQELFKIYKLCLGCLESLTSQLSCKPYTVDVQRVRMVHCMEDWGLFKDAEAESFSILEKLRDIDRRSKAGKLDFRVIHDGDKGGGDEGFCLLFVEVVVTLVKCTASCRSKESGDYSRVLGLVEEVRPWFRLLDAKVSEKTQRALITYLGKCTVFLVEELVFFGESLVSLFCLTTFAEYAKSSLRDQIYKLARRICSTLFSLRQEHHTSPLITNVLACVLKSLTPEWKEETECKVVEFLQLVCYCANKCQSAGPEYCCTFARHLEEMAGDFHRETTSLRMNMMLYAVGLKMYSKLPRGETYGSAFNILLDDEDTMQSLVTLNGFLGSFFCIGCRKGNGSCNFEHKDFVGEPCLHWKSNHASEAPFLLSWTEANLSSYLDAIKFLCQPLAESVNSERKEILADDKASSVLYNIQNTLHRFCDVFLFCQRRAYDAKRDECNENVNMLLTVVVAAFTLSFRTRVDMKRSTDLIKDIISSKWIQPVALKHLYASLNNIGLILYRNKQLSEASKALKLCCRASWTCVRHLCQMLDDKFRPSDNEFSENTVLNFVNEVITRSAFFVDMLYQRSIFKVEKAMTEILKNWSMAGKLFNGLPVPVQLVKQWVKIQCKHHKNADPTESTLTLNCLLQSFGMMSKAQIGALMEQELVEYEEMGSLYPEFCQSLQRKILSTLLRDVYITPDYRLEKARVLMKKARVLRFCGSVCLDDCIQCLSEAISTLIETAGVTCSAGVHSHQLAVAYCLRALCTHEAEPNSKRVLQDIASALSIWLEISTLDSLLDDQRVIVSEYMLLLLYNVFDLLSIKGCMDYYHDIYSLMIRLFKWKNVQLEKLLAILWESRRMSHAMCFAPANEILIVQLTEHLGELPKSIDFWINCLKTLPGMLIGFQQNFSFLCPNYIRSSCKHEKFVQLYVTVDEVKEAASQLISHIPTCKSSMFLAGHLYYDLCERLVSEGCLIEALSCAKEAHRLRSKLFQEKYIYSVEQHLEKDCEIAYVSQKPAYDIKNLRKNRSAARDVWSFDKISWDVDGCYLSPFNVLQCYLESTLQVGLVHEIIGNGSEAETLLQWGKSISRLQSLPLFEVAFASTLGKVYRKKELWSLAQKELEGAKQILKDSITSCLKCSLVLEVIVYQHLGDLFRNIYESAKGSISEERLINAEELYNLALEKLNLSAWKNPISSPDEERNLSSLTIQVEKPKARKDGKKCKKTTNARKSFQMDNCVNPQSNMRLTRSRCRSIRGQGTSNSNEVEVDLSLHMKNNVPDLSSASGQNQLHLQVNGTHTFECGLSCKNGKVGCWQCLPLELVEAGHLNNFIYVKWEFVRRRLALKQLSGLGKCLGIRGQIHQTHETILKSLSILVNRNLFFQAHWAIEPTILLNLVGKEVHGDVFAVERASVLYNICWFSLKSCKCDNTKIICCPLSQVHSETLVSWLRVALVLCCEVPVLFQKVSRLLAVMHVISSSSELFSLPSSNKILTDSHWASYFHQAAIGTHLNNQFLPYTTGRSCVQDLNFAQDFDTGGQRLKLKLFRRKLFSSQDLEEYVRTFFDGLPCVSMVCISLIEGDLACLLQQILDFSSSVHAWILMSHLNSKRQPLVLLLPVETILKEGSEDYSNPQSNDISVRNNLTKHWQCPWGSSVIDEIAPAFRILLEENYLSSSEFPSEDTKVNRKLWWKRRTKLDDSLGKLLGTIEDSWLGPWKFMLLGDRSNREHADFVLNSLVLNLKSKCKLDVNESLLKVILEGSEEVLETFDSKLYSRKGCIVGRASFYDKEKSNPFQNTLDGSGQVSGLAFKLIQNAKKELEGEDNTSREPIILVLDYNVQMLPWENIPILRNQEVYRMPSVGSICATLDGRCCQKEQDGGIMAAFPSIDPLDAFYLLNPSGDLSNTQIEFENWFKDQNLEGKAGYAPKTSELIEELKSHDLFIYFGHGSGAQYIPRHEIQKLDACAASLLMGCSSGSLTLNGYYVPQGIPLSYLKAGSPIIVANLWEVTDKDIDRFGKAILEAWLRERSCTLPSSSQCDVVTTELDAMKIGSKRANKKVASKNLSTTCESDSSSRDPSVHSRMIGSFLCEAREACTLRYLIGASPVCYGVPTSIKKKKDAS